MESEKLSSTRHGQTAQCRSNKLGSLTAGPHGIETPCYEIDAGSKPARTTKSARNLSPKPPSGGVWHVAWGLNPTRAGVEQNNII